MRTSLLAVSNRISACSRAGRPNARPLPSADSTA